MRVLIVALAVAVVGWGSDLDQVKATARELRSQRTAETAEDPHTRGASPLLTTLKHRLRDWIEARLVEVDPEGSEEALQRSLSSELDRADLLSPEDIPSPEMPSALGYLGEVQITHPGGQPGHLAVVTRAGILCGYDESVYLYRLEKNRWARLLAVEQNEYSEVRYKPQECDKILLSVADGSGSRLFLVVGINPWCASGWRSVYMRLYRVDDGGRDPLLLLERRRGAFLGLPISAHVGPDEIRIEHSVGSLDVSVHNRRNVETYKVIGDSAQRVDPVALSPNDFVEEWLELPWDEAASWLAPPRSERLRAWHMKLHSDTSFGEVNPVRKCAGDPILRQVSVKLEKAGGAHYFLVDEKAPQQYRMRDVSQTPRADCTIEIPPDVPPP